MNEPKQPQGTGPKPPRPPEKESIIHIETTRKRKAAYTRAANASNQTLIGWMFEQCDKAAGFTEDQQ